MAFASEIGTPHAGETLLYDQLVLEMMVVREGLFALGDGALIELADTLLLSLGQAAGRCRSDAASPRDRGVSISDFELTLSCA